MHPGPDTGAAQPVVADVLRAAHRLAGHVRWTALEESASLSGAAGVQVRLKLENQQRTGSFKVRGALNAVLSLTDEEAALGVVTASAGNHGLGVALAARIRGVECTVFVPASGARTKRERIERYGARLRTVEGTYDDAHAAAGEHARRAGAVYLHAFSDPAVVAGQGTAGLEVFAALPEVGTLVVPVGGGGLVGGMGVVARALGTGTRVVGVQSRSTAAMHASLAAGRVALPPMGETLCDGLAGAVDERSFALARRVVDSMVLVEEAAVRSAVGRLYREEGLVAEGSGAVGAAALWSGALAGVRGPVVVVITGGNIDAAVLSGILSGGE